MFGSGRPHDRGELGGHIAGERVDRTFVPGANYFWLDPESRVGPREENAAITIRFVRNVPRRAQLPATQAARDGPIQPSN